MPHTPASTTQLPSASPAKWHWLVTAALLGMGGLSSFSAQALSLGLLRVQSSMGESLRAELELRDVSLADANSFKAAVAPAATFRAMGIDYQPALSELTFNLQLLPDGSALLKINGSRPVTVNFVDLVLEFSWVSGRVTRDYTLLIMPSGTLAPVAPVAPVAQQAPAPAPAAEPKPSAVAAEMPAPATPAPATPAPAAPASSAGKPAAAAGTGGARLNVKAGDTASALAMQAKPINVSLDQMLLAMLRANPDAFVAGNVNRLKAGAVVELPDAEQALALDAAEARQTITLQSQDFNAFRQQLASNAKAADVAPASRAATGKVQSALEEKTPSAAPDKLTLSKGALQGDASAEEKLSQQRKAKEAGERLAELSKNISELNDLGQRSSPPAAAGSQAPAEAPAAQSAASAPEAAIPNLPAVALPAVKAAVAPNLIDRLAQHPAVLPAAGALLGLLLAWMLVRSRRNRANQESLPQHAEVAPVTGGNPGPDAMMAIPPAAPLPEDDPLVLARAELARGRDLQAEAILRMALEQTPLRMDLMLELMDLCVERQDSAAFESLAVWVLGAAGGPGPEWPLICLKGQLLDPTNPLYAPAEGAQQGSPFDNLDFDLELDANTAPAEASVSPSPDNNAKPARAAAPSGEFDMGAISLDLPTPPASASKKTPRKAP
jgi:pilus assembly protein FimV